MLQEAKDFPLDIYLIKTEIELKDIDFPLKSGDRIFFEGDLGAGKSTFIRTILRAYWKNPHLVVRSPTYTYFQKYGENIYHFDLYRLESLEDFYLIGGDDILDNKENICLIEWPEILKDHIKPTCTINIEKISDIERSLRIRHQG